MRTTQGGKWDYMSHHNVERLQKLVASTHISNFPLIKPLRNGDPFKYQQRYEELEKQLKRMTLQNRRILFFVLSAMAVIGTAIVIWLWPYWDGGRKVSGLVILVALLGATFSITGAALGNRTVSLRADITDQDRLIGYALSDLEEIARHLDITLETLLCVTSIDTLLIMAKGAVMSEIRVTDETEKSFRAILPTADTQVIEGTVASVNSIKRRCRARWQGLESVGLVDKDYGSYWQMLRSEQASAASAKS